VGDDALPDVISARCTVVAFASNDEAMGERANDTPERIGPLAVPQLPSGELSLVGCPADGLDGDLHQLLLEILTGPLGGHPHGHGVSGTPDAV
jgi:hypothetical protein